MTSHRAAGSCRRTEGAYLGVPRHCLSRMPRRLGRVAQVEGILNEEGLQVVWNDEADEHLKERLGTARE